MKALLRGIQLCVQNDLTDVIVEGDSFLIRNSLTSTIGISWSLIHLWCRILNTLWEIPRWRAEVVRRSANKMADILSELGPPVEMLFTSSLAVHISAIYHSDLTLQQHMQVQEIGSYHLQEQEGLEQQEE
ncbi:hypothetical protein MRB53_002710 [Persea americana]|uniref:Uncharacterized protein n=1 Tax=Persea americana TaxID=3435 RepID=A0ACC2MV94_PERAE|nr:hypothetical protein MRB53_002710 [Persea americana]